LKKLFFIFLFAVVLFTISLIVYSCSDNVNSYTSNAQPSLGQYFPLTAGKNMIFTVTNNWSHTISRNLHTIGTPVQIDGKSIFPWTQQNIQYPQFKDTGYFYVDGNSLYYFDGAGAAPEKVLEAPLTVGRSWLRFTPVNVNQGLDNLLDILTGNNGGKASDSSDTGGLTATKSFPTIGANYFIIGAIEEINLDNGNSYQNCIRVENQSNGFTNYYWYAPGVGLVRYVINATPNSYPGGEIVGEIS
jgi:hypothetical protein